MTRTAWWIHHPDGSRRRLSAGGVLVGREPDCDIVLRDPTASRRQVLLYLEQEGPRVVPLGRGQTKMGGAVIDAPASVLPGDRIELPGLELWVEAEEEEETTLGGQRWMLERAGGGLFGVGPHGCAVGGGATDDIQIASWPAAAATFRVAGRLVVELGAAASVDGEDAEAGEVVALSSGSTVKIGDVVIKVLVGGGAGAKTTAGSAGKLDEPPALPTTVKLQFLPRGGRLSVQIGRQRHSAYLADRRCDLIACLLQPPAPHAAGDYVPDEVLLARVWPGQTVARKNLNVLIHRVRKDLVRAGIDGTSLVTRPKGGGALRFSMELGAKVAIES